jgi:hypothetical protein
MQATRINAFSPAGAHKDDNGDSWLVFSYTENDSPTEHPLVLRYQGKYFERRGFNSDTFLIHYKEISPNNLAWPS